MGADSVFCQGCGADWFQPIAGVDAGQYRSDPARLLIPDRPRRQRDRGATRRRGALFLLTPFPHTLYALDITAPSTPVKWQRTLQADGAAGGLACCGAGGGDWPWPMTGCT